MKVNCVYLLIYIICNQYSYCFKNIMFDNLNKNNDIIIQNIITTLSNNITDSTQINTLQKSIQKSGIDLFNDIENMLNDKELVKKYDKNINLMEFKSQQAEMNLIYNITDGPISLD